VKEERFIRVHGAREHNLRGIDVEIPRDRLVVITGVSGSGKSSLAFNTVFAEGQRKYIESLSAYARQFLDQLEKPAVESITGLPPTIAIQQRTGGHNPRSTVATTTEVYDYLRLLYARCGEATCWHGSTEGSPCGLPIAATSASAIVERLSSLPEGTRLMLCAPLVRGRKGHHREVFLSMRRQGFVRARVNGSIVELRDALREGEENPLGLGRFEAHDIEAVVDRIIIAAESRGRLADSVETALRAGEGLLVTLIEKDGQWIEQRFSERFACPVHTECTLDELEPRLFSFNSPHGACPTCNGLGQVSDFDESLVIPDAELSLADGAVEPWRRNGPRMNMYYGRLTRRFCDALGVDRSAPVRSFSRAVRRVLLHGTTEADHARFSFEFEGVLPNLRRRFAETESELIRDRLQSWRTGRTCEGCGGTRLRPEARHVLLRSGTKTLGIAELCAMSIAPARAFIARLELSAEQMKIAQPIRREIESRLGFLESVGLDYLTLDRASNTLSGGEAQRIRLATQVGSGLVGVCYVLDEPTIGLHQRDNDRLIRTLRDLSDIGNTVIVVEHDDGMIRAADHVLDLGPGAGRHGGRIVAQGTVTEICAVPDSLTGAYLSGARAVALPAQRRPIGSTGAIVVRGASENNLQSIDVTIPLGGIVCVTGVSGSGKSTLVNEIVLKTAQRQVMKSRVTPGAHQKVTGLGRVDRVIEVDQSPLGRTSRSNAATYTGIFDDVRSLFAATREARARGYEAGRFSFNVKGGRCEACQGQGVRRIEMHFLADVEVTCETCRGARYNRETLEIQYRHKSIAQVLDLTVEEAIEFFGAHERSARMLQCLHDVGLDYLRLGQPSSTLSGGEAQRVKLASELGRSAGGHTLYVLDEPTTGLHFADVDRLVGVLHRLADQGNTLLVIEHNLDVVKTADWIIDLGPEGGAGGGRIVAAGTPEDIASARGSFTGAYLQPLLGPAARGASVKPRKVKGEPRAGAAAR